MSFLHPEFLYYMLLPLFVLFTLLLTQKESQDHFFSEDVISRLRVSANTLTLRARNALFLLIGILIIIALAEPVIKEGTVKVKAKSADIMIALDISDSMLAEDVYPNRLELAKQKALTLLDESPNERIGIVAFAKNSYLVSPLSFDTTAVAFLLRQLDTTSITEKGTDFLSILDVVSRSQEKQEQKYLLILSDGGDKSDFSKEIQKAKDEGIKVFVLGIGTQKGAPVKLSDGSFIKHRGEIIVSKLNESIADLATKTGGVYIQSTTSAEDIKTMFKEITRLSDEKELKSEEIPRYTPLFYYPVGLALLLLLIATSSMFKRVKPTVASTLVVCSLIFSNLHVEAGVLDFMDLNRAKEAYEKKDYELSSRLYEDYASKSGKGESYFNAGNSYYKQERYKEALEAYKKATFETKEARAKNLSNMGNAYVKEGGEKALENAIESYEESLKIKEDQNTRENLEEIKKLLEKQKQDQKNDDQKDSDGKEGENKEESKEGDKKESDENREKSSDEKDKSKDEDDSSKSKESKDKEKSSDDMNSKEEKEEQSSDKGEKPEEEKKKDELKELDKESKEDEKKDAKESSAALEEAPKNEMSEAEEMKWINQLNSKSNTYMYKLNDFKQESDDSDEKPW